jgi:hypothetical protein
MAKEYKVWIEIEEIDEANETYDNIESVSLGVFPTAKEAREFLAALEGVGATRQ